MSWTSCAQCARPGHVVWQADTGDGWQLEIRRRGLFGRQRDRVLLARGRFFAG